jgi:LDH2 family malate/lactate/ureidoglycolate dehydrogenase
MTISQISVIEATAVAERVLVALGTPTEHARVVASSLVLANRVGHDSHGLVRLVEYSGFVDRGLVDPAAKPFIASGDGGVRVIDGANGWGQVASKFAVDTVGDLADELGVASVSMRNCNHIGRIGEYAELLAARGLTSMIWCNADPAVAPFGGIDRVLGTNPFAVGIPVEDSYPVILDFATAATAEGKLRVARATGKTVEAGAIIDSQGNPSVDPEDFYKGGALLPFGGHKGYGLSVFIELLGGALSGNHPSSTSRYRAGNGVMMVAFKPTAFVPAADFSADVTETIQVLHDTTPSQPGRPVLAPGDIEASARREHTAELPIADEIWGQVLALLAERETAQ